MPKRLVKLVPENADGKSRYHEAIRNCCDRGGYELWTVDHEGNSEVIVRILNADETVYREEVGYPKAAKMLLKCRESHPFALGVAPRAAASARSSSSPAPGLVPVGVG